MEYAINSWIDSKDKVMSPIERVLQYFSWIEADEATASKINDVRVRCEELAHYMVDTLPGNPEVTVGLRDLLSAKEAFVRALLDQSNK